MSGEEIVANVIRQFSEEKSHENDPEEDEEEDGVCFVDRVLEEAPTTAYEAAKSHSDLLVCFVCLY